LLRNQLQQRRDAHGREGGPDALKARKDRAQAGFLIAVLAELRPDELAGVYDEAMARGPNWQRRIEASLAKLPNTAKRLEEVRA
jgi:hypothetical protein